VDQFVADLVDAIPPSTTTTTSTMPPPTCTPGSTIPKCAHVCTPMGLCAPGQTCDPGSCECVGPAVPCGDLPTSASGAICATGECPAGMTCRSELIPGTCLYSCGCS
jgi:hypothetical protein